MEKYNLIKEALKSEYEKRLKDEIAYLDKTNEYQKTKEDVLQWATRWQLNKRTPFKGDYETQKQKVIKALIKRNAQLLQTELNQLDFIANSRDELPNDLIITIEWKDSKMWGSNPTATTNYGFVGSSIGGCGYDKLSTATAQALNATPEILKALYNKKEKSLKDRPLINGKILNNQNDLNRHFLGYGSGYSIIPRFEGGVGVNCHKSILENLGYEMRSISDTKHTNVYLISKVK